MTKSKIASFFYSQGINSMAFYWACVDGDIETARNIEQKGFNITSDNNKAIRWACQEGRLEIVKFLAEKGADVRAQDNYPIYWASQNGHFEIFSRKRG